MATMIESGGWCFDMDAAPIDGTPVLIWSPDARGHSISLAVWAEFEGSPDGAWFDEWQEEGFPIDAWPSAWMPLPTPPKG